MLKYLFISSKMLVIVRTWQRAELYHGVLVKSKQFKTKMHVKGHIICQNTQKTNLNIKVIQLGTLPSHWRET